MIAFNQMIIIMNYFKKTRLKLILNLTKHLFFVAILALIPFSSSSQNCDSYSEDCDPSSQNWVLLSTSTNSCNGSSIPNQLDLQFSDGTSDCRSDWGLSQIFDNSNNCIKYVFITPGDYRWLGTLQMRGFCANDRKHLVYISDTDTDGSYDNEISDYITSGELVTPMDDISDPDSVVPDPLTHAILENMRLYRDGTGAGNYIIRGLSFSGIFGGIEDIVVDGSDDDALVAAVNSTGFSNWTNLNPNVYNNVANDIDLNNFLGADQCGFTSGLRNGITGTNITLDKILIENVRRGNALNLNSCHNCVVSNSIIRNSYDEFCTLYNEVLNEDNLVNGGSDNIGISVSCAEGSCEDISILNNKIYNTSDGIHFVHYLNSDPNSDNFPNGLVQNNDIYFEEARYLYLDDGNRIQQGIADGELQMIQGEDGIDIKIGGIETSPLVIRDNNIFGWRGSFGTGGHGFAIGSHINASYVTIESNHIYDCQNGIGLGNQNAGDNSLNDGFKVINNVIENLYLGIDQCNPTQNNEAVGPPSPIGIGISSVVNKDVNISGNCISETIIPLRLNGWTVAGLSGGGNMSVTSNICKNNTRPMLFMRTILLQNPDAFNNFTSNTYEYYENGSSQIFECCSVLPSQNSISNYGVATSANSFILSQVTSSSIDSDNLCEMTTEENNISCIGDCDLGDAVVTFSTGRMDFDGNTNIKVNVNPVGDYTYEWDDGTTGNTKFNACIGDDHSVTITNTLGCSQTFTFEGRVRPSFPGTLGLPYPCAGSSFPNPNPIPCTSLPCFPLPIINPSLPILTLGGGRLGTNLGQIEVWPNPANSIVNVTLDIEEFSKAEVKLFSLMGSELLSQNINPEIKKINLDVSNINNGIYLVKIITDGEETHTQKLTIAH